MRSDELLQSLLELFQENIRDADFRRAYSGKPGSRSLSRPVVTGEVAGETIKPGSEETRLCFRIFLPERTGIEMAESLFAAMCMLAREKYPGFSAISRGAADRDGATGLLAAVCTLTFLSQTDGDGTAEGKTVVLNGLKYRVSGIRTAVKTSAEELVSIGETQPFAVRNEQVEYTVELEGIDVSGLERMAGFTAELGEGPDAVYRNCHWKSLSDVLRKAVFVSRTK